MPDGLKRYCAPGHLHFITFSCCGRLPLLGLPKSRDIFVRELMTVRDSAGFVLAGYVVMPEHVHFLIGEPSIGTPSTVLHDLKLGVSRKLRGKTAFGRWRSMSEEKVPTWQARFYDFNVFTDGKRKEKLNYMHANPVVRGLVKHPGDWIWSSWGFYNGKSGGLFKIDAWD